MEGPEIFRKIALERPRENGEAESIIDYLTVPSHPPRPIVAPPQVEPHTGAGGDGAR